MQIAQILNLPIQQKISDYCSIRHIDELATLVIDHPIGFAAITLQGAHLLTWQPQNQNHPIIWLSPKSAFKKNAPIRGGVPICWPWFCDKYKPTPYHGFARISTWQLANYQEDKNDITITFSLKDNQETRSIWPYSFNISVKFYFTDTSCDIELESYGEFENTAALHSYFNVGDITKIDINGTGKHYDNTVEGGCGTLEQFPLLITHEIGHIFNQPESTTQLCDHQLKRIVHVTHQHNSDVVIWNPWVNRTKLIEDLPDDAYKTMVCIETACVNRLIRSSPNQSGKLGVKIEIEKLGNNLE